MMLFLFISLEDVGDWFYGIFLIDFIRLFYYRLGGFDRIGV